MSSPLDRRRISLRSIENGDTPFLRELYATTRSQELEVLDWTDEAKQVFLTMQFQAQTKHYGTAYDSPAFSIVMLDGDPVGRLLLNKGNSEIRIVDISILPEFRKRGIGSTLLQDVLHEADSKGVPVTIHVERFNPALELYQRLGFKIDGDTGVYHFLTYLPEIHSM